MGQCVSRKAGAVVAASGHHNSPSYRIMEKHAQKQGDHRGSSRRGTSHTRGTAMSFGFRRRPASGIPMPIAGYAESNLLHPRSKSAGPEQDRRRDEDNNSTAIHNSSSGRSTPRLAPPKKDSSGVGVRTNRFGYRQPPKFTNKVGDICNSHSISHYNQQEKQQYHHQQQQQQSENYFAKQPNRVLHVYNATPAATKTAPRTSPSNNAAYPTGNSTDANRRTSGIPEPISRYTLHTSHLPLPQYAVRVSDSNSKIAKTAANQSRKVSSTSTYKGSASSKEGSMTEDSGVSSQAACPEDNERIIRSLDYAADENGSMRRRGGAGRPRNLRMVVSGKSFDVRDVRDDDSTVTEISVIPLPKSFGSANLNTGFVRERATQYQRIVSKDNRYTESTTSMSTTSSEGYDEGCLSEEKVYKDRSHSEKIPSIKSDFSPPSSDDPEYGHGEAMADEYSLSSSDDCHRPGSMLQHQQHAQAITAATRNGATSKNALRSVLLTIEDPAFAAAAATTTTLIDDETSPVDSLFDSPTASITQSDGKASKKDEHVLERSDNTLEDDSPGTPTNASNSLSLSEGREFFDDEIADQPGLIFDDNSRARIEPQSAMGSQVITENSHTLVEPNSKTSGAHVKGVANSPHHGRIHRAGSVDTLSPCESIASDDLMLDYSDTSSYEEQQRLNSNPALHELDDATIISELEAQGEEMVRQWSSLLSTAHMQEQANSTNNNINGGTGNNNNQTAAESGIAGDRMRFLRNRSGTESPRSLDSMRNRQVSSPLRRTGDVQSPYLDSGDEASLRIDRATYQHMFQDIVSLKTMLLKLKRVLQEADTLNPFDNSVKNGLFCNLNLNLNEGGETIDVSTSPGSGGSSIADELADLRRQVIFLQGQVEDRDRTIQQLQAQFLKLQGPTNGDAQTCIVPARNNNIPSVDTCNAATQTEKTRPVSAGPSILQSLPQDGSMGPLVSWSDSWDRQRPSLLCELNSAGSLRKPTERLPHTLRLRQEQTPRRSNVHTRRHSSESVAGSPTKSKDCAKACEPNDAEQQCNAKVEGNTVKSLIPTPRKLRL
ncbi:PREDICTED: uncharacterized protein LOC106744215 isoform X2 [Dinoponera quadriceps]|uniref:Uncharacterized protein LOC106744215 isoform X2 n=1 Tax=Dinoponera quadriceps TaxID=609295 RepID=A0A6P3X7M0_DINQU|nr:PREDICTED: uncharacterized protein LOC106744215 isoform X2 [Dinoponera quadriceps]